ncbi:MAG: hypothetical protein ABIE74_04370 [Pseudomonadota bacterium]
MGKSSIKIIFILFSLILLSACSSLSGKIYYDTNGDGEQDTNEPVAAYLPIKIIFNGGEIASGVTDSDGTFMVKARGAGTYCVQFDLKAAKSDFEKVLVSKGLPVPEVTISKDVAAAVTPAGSTTSAQDSSKTEEEKKKGTDYTTMYAKGEWSKDSYCKSFKGSSLDLETVGLKVGYEYDESSDYRKETKELRVGDTYTLEVKLPKVCEIKPLQLPDNFELTAVQPDNVTLSESGALRWLDRTEDKKAPTKATGTSVATSPAFSISSDETRTAVLKVYRARKGKTQVVLKPRAKCPDKEFDLATITFDIVGEHRIKLVQDMLDLPKPGGEMRFTVTAINQGGLGLKNTDMIITLDRDLIAKDWARDKGCRLLGQNIQCSLTLPDESKVEKVFTITLPDKAGSFDIKARLEDPDLDSAIYAVNISFNLTK